MALDIVLIGFAFSAGAIAFLNPCGFAMLLTYVSYFVESSSRSRSQTMMESGNSKLVFARRIIHGALIGGLVTVTFVVIFGLTGLSISAIGIGIVKVFPWIAVLSGILIIGIGVAKALGKSFHINIPFQKSGLVYNNCNRKSSYLNFFFFGIGYALASLSCTLPIFLLVVFQGLSAGGIAEGFIAFLMYALGMGSVMIAASLAISISNQTFVNRLTKIATKMNIITSIVLILAGSYLIYYNLVVGKLLLV